MSAFPAKLAESAGLPIEKVGVVIVDHGSRREASNLLLDEVVHAFKEHAGLANVHAAHMELAEPSIATAFAAVVERGAELVIVFPYFLSPGRHWHQDIPHLAAEAAKDHPGVRRLVTSPLGLHPAMFEVVEARVTQCLDHARGGDACTLCAGTDACQLRGGC